MDGRSPDFGTRIKRTAVAAVIGAGLGGAAVQHVNQSPEPTAHPPLERRVDETNVFCRQGLVELGSIMGSEDANAITDKTWKSITGVFKEGMIDRNSLKVDPWDVSCRPTLSETGVRIEGAFAGNTTQVGVHFVSNFERSPKASADGLQVEFNGRIRSSNNPIPTSSEVGVEYPRTVDAEVKYFMGKAVDSSDPDQMRKRMDEVAAVAKKLLNIPEETPFIPDRNLTGFTTFVDDSRTGYGLYVATDGDISGYTASIRVHEGLSGDERSWKDIAERHGIDPTKVSYAAFLKNAVTDLDRENTVRHFMNRPPCPGSADILRLAGQNTSYFENK